MNDTQEEHFGMFLKTNHFLGVNAAALAINAAIAAAKVKLEGRIGSITAQDVIANTDNEGYTIAKVLARTALENKVIHVSEGLTGYYRAPYNPQMLGKVDQENSFFLNASEDKLNTQSELIHQIADPVKALLGSNFVTSADVDALNTARQAFLALYAVPKEKIGNGVAARKELVRLFDLTNADLKGELDDLMEVQESVNPILFSKYQSARAIDNMGGGSGTDGYDVATFIVPGGGGSVLFPLLPGPILPTLGLYIRSIQGSVVICTTNLPAMACAGGYEAFQGVTFKGEISEMGLDLSKTHVQFTNPGLDDAIVRAGTKSE